MRIDLAYISARRGKLKSSPIQVLVEEFTRRAARYEPTQLVAFESETALLAQLSRGAGRVPPTLVLLDSRGDACTSEQIAERLDRFRSSGLQQVIFAVGPPDGWSAVARERAAMAISFGRITLPHELALLVLAEQVYRGLSILAGHPYHGGHL